MFNTTYEPWTKKLAVRERHIIKETYSAAFRGYAQHSRPFDPHGVHTGRQEMLTACKVHVI